MEYGRGENYRNDSFYKQIIKKSSNGFSYCKIVRNHCDIPIDYEYIEVNSAFEELTGLKEPDIIGKKGSLITQDLQDAIQKAMVNGRNNEVDICLSNNKKWLRVNIDFLNDNNFVCIYNDVSYEYAVKQEIKELFEINLDMICVTDTDFNFRNINNEFINVVGYAADELIGKNFFSFVHREDLESTNIALKNIENQKEYVKFTNRFRCKDNSYRFLEWRTRLNGRYIYASARDITKKKDAEEALLESEAKFRAISETALDAVILIDNNGKVMYWSPSAEKIFGYTRTEIMGKNLHSMIMPIKYSEQFEEGFKEFKNSGQGNAIGKLIELTAIHKNGREFPVEIALTSVPIQGQFWSSAIIRDITNRKEVEETLFEKLKQIEYLSFHDHLTGLYNRRYMEDAIQRLDVAGNLPFTYMELDINGLKITNDAFGHEMGDKLIKAVADIIKKVCRADDIIARIGGDEFAILLPHIDKTQADIIKHQIKDEALKTDLDSAIVSVAIGYRVKTGMNQNIIEIQKEADDDMYKDKIKHGKTIRSQMIENVLRNINSKYDDEQIHMERISSYCESIARAMNLNEVEISDIKVAGSLHDIGKIMIPSDLLHKKGRLTEREWKIIKRHSEIGYQILRGVDEYAALAEAVLYHHERWDGKGYPKGLKGEAIPIQSRIIAVADAFEAMTTLKPYQKTKSKSEAIEELKRCAGTQFDQNVVRIFVEIVL